MFMHPVGPQGQSKLTVTTTPRTFDKTSLGQGLSQSPLIQSANLGNFAKKRSRLDTPGIIVIDHTSELTWSPRTNHMQDLLPGGAKSRSLKVMVGKLLVVIKAGFPLANNSKKTQKISVNVETTANILVPTGAVYDQVMYDNAWRNFKTLEALVGNGQKSRPIIFKGKATDDTLEALTKQMAFLTSAVSQLLPSKQQTKGPMAPSYALAALSMSNVISRLTISQNVQGLQLDQEVIGNVVTNRGVIVDGLEYESKTPHPSKRSLPPCSISSIYQTPTHRHWKNLPKSLFFKTIEWSPKILLSLEHLKPLFRGDVGKGIVPPAYCINPRLKIIDKEGTRIDFPHSHHYSNFPYDAALVDSPDLPPCGQRSSEAAELDRRQNEIDRLTRMVQDIKPDVVNIGDWSSKDDTIHRTTDLSDGDRNVTSPMFAYNSVLPSNPNLTRERERYIPVLRPRKRSLQEVSDGDDEERSRFEFPHLKKTKNSSGAPSLFSLPPTDNVFKMSSTITKPIATMCTLDLSSKQSSWSILDPTIPLTSFLPKTILTNAKDHSSSFFEPYSPHSPSISPVTSHRYPVGDVTFENAAQIRESSTSGSSDISIANSTYSTSDLQYEYPSYFLILCHCNRYLWAYLPKMS
ncbi:uncharacterized protein MELLADRAFT_106403 [Melampsora larici-populina 98AG31]|uniref:Uncharacterized protein n=1 Tax=Melampsora larici-populina (strain 98AG31 / pathotype 3-4-7) TaxID=747676 RepID=F4RL99_MELLP|nr:uncharacterized protein MELLADRAFT_106403 [Melampsora larici-populina 98AG31]EGG06907.1 hypothetical protein MELLADRAFT_106403 [Melampsora larici-populina 98AG31]